MPSSRLVVHICKGWQLNVNSCLPLQFDQIYRPYIQYCMEHSSCLQYLKEKRKSNLLFKSYILVSTYSCSCWRVTTNRWMLWQWCENHKDCERLRLMDLLVKPMQRLTKYSLLLKAILKKTDNEAHKESLRKMVGSVDCLFVCIGLCVIPLAGPLCWPLCYGCQLGHVQTTGTRKAVSGGQPNRDVRCRRL